VALGFGSGGASVHAATRRRADHDGVLQWNGRLRRRRPICASRRLGNRSDAEEFATEAFLPVLRRRPRHARARSGVSGVLQEDFPDGSCLSDDSAAPMESSATESTAVSPPCATARQRLSGQGDPPLVTHGRPGVLSRFGVMFFDDPHGAFADLHHALRPGGRLVFSGRTPLDPRGLGDPRRRLPRLRGLARTRPPVMRPRWRRVTHQSDHLRMDSR
jgi:hypothetical protein